MMEETLRDTTSTCGGHWLLQIAPSSPDNRFPSRARSVPSCTFLAMWFAALLGGGRQVFWDGVSGRGGCDPLAHGAKSSSSDSVKGELWRIQPEAEGAGSPCAPFSQESGKSWNSDCHLEGGTCTTHSFTAVMGLSFLPRLSLSPGLAFTQNSCRW